MGFNTLTDALSRIAVGNVPGATAVYFQAYNPSPTTSYETIWANGTLYAFLTANMSSPTLVSSSANDAAAGTGARTVLVSGVNSSYVAQSETVTLNGATPVALTNNYMTINSMVVLTVGSGGVAAGTLTLAAGGVTHATIAAANNQSSDFIYCTTSTQGLLLYDFNVAQEAASAGGNRAGIFYSTSGGPLLCKVRPGFPTNFNTSHQFTVPLYFPPNTQIQAQYLSAAATSVVTATATGVLVDVSTQNYAKWI